MGPLGLDLIPQGRLSAARGRMVCVPTYGALQEARRAPAWFGFASCRGGYQPPAGAWYAPLHMGPARSTPCACPVWVCFAGAAISRPRAHGMRPYIWGPARSTPCARPVWVCFVGAAISRPRAHGMRPCIWGPARSTPWVRLVWVCFAGTAISRPWAHILPL